jgi:hypothetical protein
MKRVNFKTLLGCVALTAILPLKARAGQDRSGGDPRRINQSLIELLVKGSGLKAAMLNYANSVVVEQIGESDEKSKAVKATLKSMLKNGELQRDIQSSPYVSASACLDSYTRAVPASTRVNHKGDEICFDSKQLAEDYKNLSVEEIMINLAALAFHEHVHHFQSARNNRDANENQAYLVSAYVKITAKLVQAPLLKWSAPSTSITNEQICDDKLSQLYREKLKNDSAFASARKGIIAQFFGDDVSNEKRYSKVSCSNLKETYLGSETCSAFRCGELMQTRSYLIAETVEGYQGQTKSVLTKVYQTEIGGGVTKSDRTEILMEIAPEY